MACRPDTRATASSGWRNRSTVWELVPGAGVAHGLAIARIYEREYDDGRAPARSAGCELDILGARDTRVMNHLELEVGKLALDCHDDARRCLSGRVRDDVELNGTWS